ncbi:MAG: hypothetical protein KME64_35255 [Scytonematopsis contorta HA4267-MV1]|jgi:hypothetical protein|nr:hypothetical protein [Scytonematopsis contorta HA4267-MV1]
MKNDRIINIGEQFGSWTILEKQGRQILCQCNCGTKKLVYKHTIINGKSSNCGCERRAKKIPVGTNIGRLTVISDVEIKGERGKIQVLTRCSCEAKTQKYINKSSLIRGLTRSCGCIVKENCRNKKTIHGKCNTYEYYSWLHIKRICYNKNYYQYKYYGRCGIKIDPSWYSNFSQFLKDMGVAPEGTIISRIDTEKDFTPNNCLWIPRKERYKQIHLLRRKNNIAFKTFPNSDIASNKINTGLPPNIIQAVIETHANGEGNIKKIAAQYKISVQGTINIILRRNIKNFSV